MMNNPIRTMVVAMSFIAICCDVFASPATAGDRGICFGGRASRRRVSLLKQPPPLLTVLAEYHSLSDRLRAFLIAQINDNTQYGTHLDTDLLYELLSYRSQVNSKPLEDLLSMIKEVTLCEGDLAAFSKFGCDMKYFTGLERFLLFCSGLTRETFPDLSTLKIKKLTLYYCGYSIPISKLPENLEEIGFNCSPAITDFPWLLTLFMPSLKKLNLQGTLIPNRDGIFNVTTGEPIDVQWRSFTSDAAARASA